MIDWLNIWISKQLNRLVSNKMSVTIHIITLFIKHKIIFKKKKENHLKLSYDVSSCNFNLRAKKYSFKRPTVVGAVK